MAETRSPPAPGCPNLSKENEYTDLGSTNPKQDEPKEIHFDTYHN